MQCWQCGKELAESSAFCITCGAPRSRPGAIEDDPSEEKVHALLAEANLLRLRKNWSGAIARCTEALRIAASSASAHSLLGDVCRDEGRLQDAIEWYKLALGLDSTRKRDREQLDALIDKIYGAGKMPTPPEGEGKASVSPPKAKSWRPSNVLVLIAVFALILILLGGLAFLLVYRQKKSSPNPQEVILTQPEPGTPSSEPEASSENPAPAAEETESPAAQIPGDGQNTAPQTAAAPARTELSDDVYFREKQLTTTLKNLLSQAGEDYNLLGVLLDPRSGKLEISFALPSGENSEASRGMILESSYYLARAAALKEPAVATITVRAAMKFPAGDGTDNVPAFLGDADGAQLRKTPEGAVTSQEAAGYFSSTWWLALLQQPKAQ
jgi:tetratricopeptide (TPR) repeat protein